MRLSYRTIRPARHHRWCRAPCPSIPPSCTTRNQSILAFPASFPEFENSTYQFLELKLSSRAEYASFSNWDLCPVTLPFPKTDRAHLPPCTVRWQFAGKFNLNKEEDIARGSIRVQGRKFMQLRGIAAPEVLVNFPRGTGRNKFVELTVPKEQLAILSETTLVFNQSKLQRVLVGPALSCNYLAIEILGVPQASSLKETARYFAQTLRSYVQVHDVWVRQISYAGDPTPPADTNRLVALVSTTKGDNGGLDPVKLHAIPGFLHIGNTDCELSYIGRLQWCTTCRSDAGQYHTFDDCPRRRCFNCGATGHTAAVCTEDYPIEDDKSMVDQQANEEARGTSNLNYGTD